MASLDQEGGRGATILLRLVRHGESLHNISSVAAYGDQGADPSLYDAPLSPRGEAQASEAWRAAMGGAGGRVGGARGGPRTCCRGEALKLLFRPRLP